MYAHKSGTGGGEQLKITHDGVKVNGKLGVGTAADASIQMTVGGAGSQVMQVKSTDSHASVQIDRKNATADANLMLLTNGVSKWRLATGLAGNDEKLSIYDDIANTNMMTFKTAVGVGVGPSFGTNEPTAPLQVDYGSNPSGSVDVLKIGAVVGSGYDEEFRIKFYSGTASLGYIGGSHKDDGASGASQGYLAFGTRTGSAVVERLRIDHDGTQDHKANRIVNSQTVSDSWRSSEPSLRFDGANDFVDLTSGGLSIWAQDVGTVSVWFKPEQVGSAADILHIDQSSYTDYWLLRQNADGTIRVQGEDGNSSTGVIESTTAVVAGEWNHVVVTCAGSGSNQTKIYLNGVEEATATFSEWTGHLTALQSAWLGKSDWNKYKGEIRDLRWHNRAMDAAEIKGLYNGESTPWEYTTLQSRHTSNFSSGTNSYNGSGGTTSGNNDAVLSQEDDCLKFVVDSSNGPHQVIKSISSTTTGRAYKISGKIYIPSGNTDVNAVQINEDGNGDVNVFTTITTTGSWVNFSGVQTWNGYGELRFRALKAQSTHSYTGNGSDEFFLKDVELEEAGEVAAYTPQSINDKWYDTTSNANHGTITGATTVGNTKHLGPLHIKGKTTAGIILENTTNAQDANIDYYNNVGGVQSRIAYAEGAGAFTFVPNVGGLPSGTLRLEHGNASGGAVTATSASSTNLKQVARVEGNQVTWPNATASTVAFRIDHGLGVDAPIVQVYEDAAPYGLVDVEVRQGDWIGADFGAVGTEQGASESAKDANRIRYVTVVMAANPGNATKWNYRVTG
jgi:hypothetical protein